MLNKALEIFVGKRENAGDMATSIKRRGKYRKSSKMFSILSAFAFRFSLSSAIGECFQP